MSKATYKTKNLACLLPIQGVSYSPAPSDDTPAPLTKFFDTDFANSSFPLLWDDKDKGRGDVKNLADIGVNFIHLYNWSVPPAPGLKPGDYERNHLPFLKKCGEKNVNVFVPISNYFLELIHNNKKTKAKSAIKAMVAEVYSATDKNNKPAPVAGAAMWGIGNEYDLAGTLFDVNDVAVAMAYLVDAETNLNVPTDNLLPVTSPVSFGVEGGLPPGIAAIQSLESTIKANTTLGKTFWDNRFVASTNPFNGGAFLTTYISTTFPQYFPKLPFFFAEMGCPIEPKTSVKTEKEQATYVAKQLNATDQSGNFLGRCVFQFLDQTAMKTGTEATFGMTKFAPAPTPPKTIQTGKIKPSGYVPGGGANYNVDALTQKPLYDKVKEAYS